MCLLVTPKIVLYKDSCHWLTSLFVSLVMKNSWGTFFLWKRISVLLCMQPYLCMTMSLCLFSVLLIICLYVNEMLIIGTTVHVVNDTKILLSSYFEMKDMKKTDEILGVKARKTNDNFSFVPVSSHWESVKRNLTILMRFQWELLMTLAYTLKRIRGGVIPKLSMLKS